MLAPEFEIGKDFDYVFMHEDDILIRHPFILNHLIILLERDSHLSQVQLKRTKWYHHEKDVTSKDDDWSFGDFRYEKFDATPHFWGMMSIWPSSVCKENITEETGYRLGENIIGTDTRAVKQNSIGTLFMSQDSALWTEDQTQDIKFT